MYTLAWLGQISRSNLNSIPVQGHWICKQVSYMYSWDENLVISGHFNFPQIPKWRIMCEHSPLRAACREAQHGWGPGARLMAPGGVQGAKPLAGFRGRSPQKLMGFSTLKVQENLFRKVKFTQSLQVFLASVLIMSDVCTFMLFWHVCYDVELKFD